MSRVPIYQVASLLIAASFAAVLLASQRFQTTDAPVSLQEASGCGWQGSSWICNNKDYHLRVVYPNSDATSSLAETSSKMQLAQTAKAKRTIQIIDETTDCSSDVSCDGSESPGADVSAANDVSENVIVPIKPKAARKNSPPKRKAQSGVSQKTLATVQKSIAQIEKKLGSIEQKIETKIKAPAPAPAPVAAKPSSPARPANAVKPVQKKVEPKKKPVEKPFVRKPWPKPEPFKPRPLPKIRAPPMKAPWSPPMNLYLFWGTDSDKWTSAESIRHLVKIGHIEGGEYRDAKFVKDLESQQFRDLTLTCCNVLLFPPFAHGFPVFQGDGRMQHRITRFVSNGNTMIFTGLTALMFINRIFKYELETVDYSPGPFTQYERGLLPASLKTLHPVLPQEGTHVTVVEKGSMPIGVQLFYASPEGSPFFSLKYCEVNNPVAGEYPIRVIPRDCPKWEKKKNPCACGNIIYLGYDYPDGLNERWDEALRASLGLVIGKPDDE